MTPITLIPELCRLCGRPTGVEIEHDLDSLEQPARGLCSSCDIRQLPVPWSAHDEDGDSSAPYCPNCGYDVYRIVHNGVTLAEISAHDYWCEGCQQYEDLRYRLTQEQRDSLPTGWLHLLRLVCDDCEVEQPHPVQW